MAARRLEPEAATVDPRIAYTLYPGTVLRPNTEIGPYTVIGCPPNRGKRREHQTVIGREVCLRGARG